MNSTRFFFTWYVAVSAFLISCQTVQKAPEPLSPPPQKTFDLQHRFVQQKIFILRDAFVAGDIRGFMSHVSKGFYQGHTRLENSFREFQQRARGISLRVTVEDIQLEEEKSTAVIRWTRSAVDKATKLRREVRGETILIFHNTDKLRLLDFRKDPIFGLGGS